MQQRLTPHEARAVAVRAGVDPRTVRAYLAGKPQRSTVVARVSEALREMEMRGSILSHQCTSASQTCIAGMPGGIVQPDDPRRSAASLERP
jgi:hypothetical protein